MSTGHDPDRTADTPADDTLGEAAGGAAGAGAFVAGSGASPSAVGASAARASGSKLVFDDPLDRVSADDTDRGWGGPSLSTADDDFTRFLNEKPPHHL